MHSIFSVFILSLSLIINSASYPQKGNETSGKKLLGKWETINKTSETSITYEFMPENKFRYMLTSGLNGNYKLIGNRLISFYKIPSLKSLQTDTTIILVRLDTLYEVTTQGNKEIVNKLVRLNGKARPGTGIIGEWINTTGIRRNVLIFRPNGKLELRNVLRNVTGKYSVVGNNVTVVSRGTTVMKYRYAFDNGILLLYVDNVSAPIKLKKASK